MVVVCSSDVAAFGMPRVATGQGQWPEGGPILEVLDWQLARWNFLESSAGAYEPGPACAAAALNIPTFLNKSTFFPKDGVQKGRAPPQPAFTFQYSLSRSNTIQPDCEAGKTTWVECFSGKGSGTAGVAFSTAEEVANAITMLNGTLSTQIDANRGVRCSELTKTVLKHSQNRVRRRRRSIEFRDLATTLPRSLLNGQAIMVDVWVKQQAS